MKRSLIHTNITRFVALLIAALMVLSYAPSLAQTSDASFHNPLNSADGADPWLTYYDGYYYLATTTSTGAREWSMRKSATLSGLKVAKPEVIYKETDPSRCCSLWAPEFHLLDGPDGKRWYFYYSAGTNGSTDNQHTHVLESAGTDPMGPYTYKARIFDPTNDGWAIDGSILQLKDKLYFLFSSWVGDYQELFIAPMSNPWTISGSRILLTQSQYNWEKSQRNVTEGPVALQHDGKTFIIYSASFCWSDDYKLGMLAYNGGDVLDTKSWVKSPEPVFQRSDENNVYAPGHNGFFKSPDGTEDWIVYHANDNAGDGCVGKRTTRAQKFTWNADGTPNFGVPVSITTDIPNPSGDKGIDPMPQFLREPTIHLTAYDEPTKFINHFTGRGKLSPLGKPAGDFEFALVKGLADPSAISIESASTPGWYLINRNGTVWLAVFEDSDDFRTVASWWQKPGLASADDVSFESVSQAGAYLLHQQKLLNVKVPSSDTDKDAATFVISEVEK